MCEINSHALDKENLDEFFGKSDPVVLPLSPNKAQFDQHQNNSLQPKYINEIFKTLYGKFVFFIFFIFSIFTIKPFMFILFEKKL